MSRKSRRNYIESICSRQVYARTPSSPAFAIFMLDDVRRRQEKKNVPMASRATYSFAEDRLRRRDAVQKVGYWFVPVSKNTTFTYVAVLGQGYGRAMGGLFEMRLQ